MGRDRYVRRLCRLYSRHHILGSKTDGIGRGFLLGWRRHHRFPERPCDRRRLHVGGLFPRHLGPGLHFRLRWPDLLGRLARRLANRHVPDRRAAAQSREVHVCRRHLVPARADRDPHSGGLRLSGHRRLLPDRADGRRWQADPVAVRSRLLDGGRSGRRPDDDLRDLRRHESDDLGADHQGRAVVDGCDIHGRCGLVQIWLQPRSPVRQGRPKCIQRRPRSWSPAA